jgi:hypothetical protein
MPYRQPVVHRVRAIANRRQDCTFALVTGTAGHGAALRRDRKHADGFTPGIPEYTAAYNVSTHGLPACCSAVRSATIA